MIGVPSLATPTDIILTPCFAVQNTFTFEDFLKSYFNKTEHVILDPTPGLEKLVDTYLYDHKASLAVNMEEKIKYMKEQKPSETMVECLAGCQLLEKIMPKTVEVATTDPCKECGAEGPNVTTDPIQVPFLSLGNVKPGQTIEGMIYEQLDRTHEFSCSNDKCTGRVKMTSHIHFTGANVGFIAAISRVLEQVEIDNKTGRNTIKKVRN